MNKAWRTFTQEEVDRIKSFGDVVCGVPYHYDLVSWRGAAFIVIKENGVTHKMLREAAKQIRRDHDVVGAIRWAEVVG